MTKGAIGNLINRYRSVLNKCRLNNMLAKMFVAGTVMLAAPLMVESLTSVSGDTFFLKTASAASEHEIGPGETVGVQWWWNGSLTVTGPDTTVNGNINWWEASWSVKDPEPTLTVQGPNTTINGDIYWNNGSSITVTGENTTIHGSIHGGKGSSITVTGPGTAVTGDISGSFGSESADTTVSRNSVTVATGQTDGTRTSVNGTIDGVYTFSYKDGVNLTAEKISVSLTDSDVTAKNFYNAYGIYGAYIDGINISSAHNNSVSLDNSSATGDIYGSCTYGKATSKAYLNVVTVKGSSSVKGSVYGAYANSKAESLTHDNSVTLDNSSVTGGVYGSFTTGVTSTVHLNVVAAKGKSSVDGSVYGAYVEPQGGFSARDNAVSLEDSSSVTGSVSGLYAQGGTADSVAEINNNTVTLTGNSHVFRSLSDWWHTGSAYGANVEGSGKISAEKNSVTLANSTANGEVAGLKATRGETDTSAPILHNFVTLTDNSHAGSAYVVRIEVNGKISANENNVSLGKSTVDVEVAGFRATRDELTGAETDSAAKMFKNSATLTDSHAGSVYGARAEVNREISAYENFVTIDNSTVDGEVAGAWARRGGTDVAAQVYSNVVTVKGEKSSIGGDVYGGYANNSYKGGDLVCGEALAYQNSIVLEAGTYGNADVRTKGIYGGFAWSLYDTASVSGNEVTVGSNVKLAYDVYGGYARTGGPAWYEKGSSAEADAVASASKISGNEIQGNTLTIDGAESTGRAMAGYASNYGAGSSHADGNVLTIINGAHFDFHNTDLVGLTGGDAEIVSKDDGGSGGRNATANNNRVTIGGRGTLVDVSAVTGSVIGGRASHNDNAQSDSIAQANGNEVSIQDEAVVKGHVNGAEAGGESHLKEGYAEAQNNRVTVANATVSASEGDAVNGAYAYAPRVLNTHGNTVSISKSSHITGAVNAVTIDQQHNVDADFDYGAPLPAVVTRGNKVDVKNSDVDGTVRGSNVYASSGIVDSGSGVSVADSTIKGDVMGDYLWSVSGNASAEQIESTISNSAVQGGVTGGRAYAEGSDYAANASSNKVIVSGSTVGFDLNGGWAETQGSGKAEAANNAVILTGTSVALDVTAGYALNNGSGQAVARENALTLFGGKYDANIYGGRAFAAKNTAEAETNFVFMSLGRVKGTVYGGMVETGDAVTNTVVSYGSTVNGGIEGSHTGSGTARGSVHLYGGEVGDHVYGGSTGNGSASHNDITIDGATVTGRVVGGQSSSGDTVSNHVVAYDGTVTGGIEASHTASGDASNSSVTLEKGTISDHVFAGYTGSGTASRENIVLNGTTVNGEVAAGWSESGDAVDNTVVAYDSTVTGGIAASHTGAGNASNNSVLLNGGTTGDHVYGGSTGNGTARRNDIKLNGATVNGDVIAGRTDSGEASANTVFAYDSTVNGGIEAGHTGAGNATDNIVLADGSTITGRLYGGYTDNGSATRNSITVLSGRVDADVVGGYDDGTATDNTVTLYDAASFTGSNFYGGRSAGSSSDVFTGNTLNVHGQIDGASLQNFQNLNFSDVADHQASVDLSKSAIIGDRKGSMTNVFIANLKDQSGPVPEEYVLVHTPKASSSFTGTNLYVNGDRTVTIGPDGNYVPYSGTVANDGTMDNATGSTGMTKSQTLTKGFLEFDVDYFIKNGQDLIARSKKESAHAVPETQNFTANRAASAELMDIGADFVAGEGIDRALQASQCLPGEPCGAKAFMAVNGGYSTFLGGTTTTMSYGNLLAGLARQCKIGPMGYLAGVFFETGLGRFHSEYEPDDSRAIDSEGHDYYYGIGALAKVFLNRDALKGLYAEGSIRYGLMMSDWQSHDIQVNGRNADWDGRDLYLTAHGGLGYMWDVTDNVTADVYAKYFWGHLWGDDGSICGEKFEFDDIYSSRVRTGGRLNFKKDDSFSWYLGGAWEHEFDMKSRATLYGNDVPSTNYSGNTGIAEAGVYYRPEAAPDWSFTLGATGYFGEKREGVTGHLQIRYEF